MLIELIESERVTQQQRGPNQIAESAQPSTSGSNSGVNRYRQAGGPALDPVNPVPSGKNFTRWTQIPGCIHQEYLFTIGVAGVNLVGQPRGPQHLELGHPAISGNHFIRSPVIFLISTKCLIRIRY